MATRRFMVRPRRDIVEASVDGKTLKQSQGDDRRYKLGDVAYRKEPWR
jgi:hypothetical protein